MADEYMQNGYELMDIAIQRIYDWVQNNSRNTVLDLSGLNLIVLPTLPAIAYHVYCDNNQLTALPRLPTNLITLYCNNNQLTTLPILPNSLKKIVVDDTNLFTNTQIQQLLDNHVTVIVDGSIILLNNLQQNNSQDYKNDDISSENIVEYKNNYHNDNNKLNCSNDTTFLGDTVDNIDKIFLFLNEDTDKYNIYCYTTDELIDTLLKSHKIYKWKKDLKLNLPGKPDLNKRILKEPYTNSYINFDNLNKIIIYNCFLLKPTRKYRLGTGDSNWVSSMHGTDDNIHMVYDIYPINYELIKNKLKIIKDNVINFVPKLEDIDNRYTDNLIITNLDTDEVIDDINTLNKNINYQISNKKIKIINTKLYRQDILNATKEYPDIINATEFIRN